MPSFCSGLARLHTAIAVISLAVTLAGPALAQQQNVTSFTMTPERIVTPLPDGWKVIYHAKNERREIQQYVPDGQSIMAWDEMVTSKIFDRMTRGPRDYNIRTMDSFAKLCSHATKIIGETELRFGYESSLAFIECVTTPETRQQRKFVRKVEFMVQLAIKGKDALYVAASAWHSDDLDAPRPTQDPDLLKAITSKLDRVFVCDDRLKERKCETLQAKAG